MKSLAYTPPKPDKAKGVTPVSIVSDDESDPKPQFPSFRLNGEQAKAAGLDKCAYGDEYEIKIRIKATRIGGSEWELKKDGLPPVEFDVLSSDTPEEVEPEEEESEEEESEEEEKSESGEEKFAKSVKSPSDLGMED